MSPSLPIGYTGLPSVRDACATAGVKSLKDLALVVSVFAPPRKHTLRDLLVDFVDAASPRAPVNFYPRMDMGNHPVDGPITWDDPQHGGLRRAMQYDCYLQWFPSNDQYGVPEKWSQEVITTNGAAHVSYTPSRTLRDSAMYELYATPLNAATEVLDHDWVYEQSGWTVMTRFRTHIPGSGEKEHWIGGGEGHAPLGGDDGGGDSGGGGGGDGGDGGE